mgnify:CR=1 FL=1
MLNSTYANSLSRRAEAPLFFTTRRQISASATSPTKYVRSASSSP